MGSDKGSYVLLLRLDSETTIAVGKLGVFFFPAGYYLYAGSALGGLCRRLRHHLRRDKKLRWHIDYLGQRARPIEVWYSLAEDPLECLWSSVIRDLPQAQVIAPGFGSSDCRCRSHLAYFPALPSFEAF